MVNFNLDMRFLTIAALFCMLSVGCSQNQTFMKPYVVEVTTFKYKETVDTNTFWTEDTKVEEIYTSKQPGFISRESGFSESNNEVIVIVRWKSQADADASMEKFMTDESVKTYANMIDGASMKMARYDIK